ncbi:MAG: NAD-binding protein [Candidatus Micrarchaeota archaeon]|nr:NAD-binding protein [Candidatus Micrarchaeota archaeon]
MVSKVTAAIYMGTFVAVLVFGTVGTYYIGNHDGFNQPIGSFLNSIYFTIITISTLGYGDIYPVTGEAKVFVMVLIITGVTTFLSTIVLLAGDIMNERIEALTGRLTAFDKRVLNKHIVLIGSNTTNMTLADMFKEKGEKFILISSDKTIVDKMRDNGIRAFVADSISESDMRVFGLDKASGIVIDNRDSSKTVYTLMVVRELAKRVKTVVIAPNRETERHLRNLAGSNATIISPAEIAASTANGIFSKHK